MRHNCIQPRVIQVKSEYLNGKLSKQDYCEAFRDSNPVRFYGSLESFFYVRNFDFGAESVSRARSFFTSSNGHNAFCVPCGSCVLCVQRYRKEWALRAYLESLEYGLNCCFLTLTYSDEHLPEGSNVSLTDLQKFWKRLRKNLGDVKIRYFAVSEYGSKSTKRPHYHAIVYGVSYGQRDIIERSWGKGFIKVKPCCEKTCKYVAKYALKGITKTREKSEYRRYLNDKAFFPSLAEYGSDDFDTDISISDVIDFHSRPPPKVPNFFVMSRRIGIGVSYVLRKKKELLQRPFIYLGSKNNKVYLPRFLMKKLFDSDQAYKDYCADYKASVQEEDLKAIEDSYDGSALSYLFSLAEQALIRARKAFESAVFFSNGVNRGDLYVFR